MKLTKGQQDLYDAMKAGVIVRFLSGYDPHYWRSDNMRRCNRQVDGLWSRGLIEKYDEDWRGHKLRIKPCSPS